MTPSSFTRTTTQQLAARRRLHVITAAQKKWSEYVDKYTRMGLTEPALTGKVGRVFLQRCVATHGSGRSLRLRNVRSDESKAVLDLVGYSNLACNIHPNTYKLTFVANVRG